MTGVLALLALAGAAPASGAWRVAHRSYARPTPPRLSAGERAPRPLARSRRPPHLHELPANATTSIVGGTDAAQGQLGFMAFVVYEFSSTSFAVCSGTVVSPNVVLTAGHCAVDESTGAVLDPSGFTVFTGSVDWTDAAVRQRSTVAQVIVDPAYDPATHESDAALLVLNTPTAAPSIRLATSTDLSLEQGGTGSLIAGWGDTYQGSPPSDVLQWAETVVQPPAYCDHFARTYDPALQLCAVNYPYDDTAVCNGDSGGPLLAPDAAGRPVEIGITSYGPVDCNTASADYFTAVEPLSAWASAEIQAVAPPPPPPPPSPPPPPPAAPTTPPPPKVNPPQPTLPRMSASVARSLARQTLAGALRGVFKRERSYRASCSRASAVRFTCDFTFSSGPNDYYGTVSVYYVRASGSKVYWTDRFVAHWVNDACYFHSGHRRRCKVGTRRGTW